MPDEATAASSPAPETSELPGLDTLNVEQYNTWREKGTLPEAAPPKSAESAPAPPAATEGLKPPVETAPASEPGKTAEEPKPKGAEARKAQLNAEIQDLLKQRREAREALEAENGGKPAAASPAAAASVPRPVFKDYLAKAETYEDAVQEWSEALSDWKIGQYVAEQQAAADQRAEREHQEAYHAKLDRDSTEIADFDAVTTGAESLRCTPAMVGFIHETEIPAKILYHLAKNPAEFHRIAALTPAKAIRELGKIEDALTGAAPAAPGPSLVPPAKKNSSAPPPPTELAARNATAGDEIEEALAAKDFRRYSELANARDLKRRA